MKTEKRMIAKLSHCVYVCVCDIFGFPYRGASLFDSFLRGMSELLFLSVFSLRFTASISYMFYSSIQAKLTDNSEKPPMLPNSVLCTRISVLLRLRKVNFHCGLQFVFQTIYMDFCFVAIHLVDLYLDAIDSCWIDSFNLLHLI